MAIQLWQQILLSDPKNPEALVGLARDLKLIGSDKAADALDRLREARPTDPNIGKIEALASTRVESNELRKAGDLARQGKLDDAMRIYKQLYGDHPPDGDIALAYYQTMYGTGQGKEQAVTAMRALAERNPGDPRFAVELGIMLTYDSRTRAEGIRMLETHPKDASAQAALRQALVWDSANPASAAELRQYLKDHPQDTDLLGRLKEDESKLAQMNSGIARTPAEKEAFAALNAHRMEDAEKRFTAILQQDPQNGRAAAGMGFLRMQQNNFGAAISFLAQAEENGFKAKPVEDALATSRFWFTMSEASQAFDDNDLDVAAAKYRAALVMRPRSPEALNGLAGLLTKQEQFSAAAMAYDELLKVQPGSTAAWRGLFLAYARDNQNQKAIAIAARFPAGVKAAVAKDPDYLRTLAGIYQATGRGADAQRVLAQALALPFPEGGATLKADTKLQYAGILMQAKRYEQAANLYAQILNDDQGNLSAWMGLVSAHHELGLDAQAIGDVDKMPPSTYESALNDPGFLSMMAAMYQQANQFEIAQTMLERSQKIQTAGGGAPSISLQLQLAGIYLQRNNTAQAYAIYQQVLAANPDRVDAWKGLIATLMATNRNSEAVQEIAVIPVPVRRQLEQDIEFIQSEASLYAASGDFPHAVDYMNRVQSHYASLHQAIPPNIDIQDAWLLFNTRNDRLLYQTLMRLGGRADLTVAQRETVQDIWANWSVRRAAFAMDNGNVQRAVDILDAASQAFPDNVTVRKAVAGGYAQVGRSRESLALYKTVPMQDATAGDFGGAIGAALAAGDKNQAEIWLRQALARFPRDPSVLELAARYEQARGDNQRAADYYKAALAAMPSASPAQRLAHVLVYPEQDTRARKAMTAADLQHLLDPNYEPFAKTTTVSPLPAYGKDPYNGSAPVVLTPNQTPDETQQQTQPVAPNSSLNNAPLSSTPSKGSPSTSNPAVWNAPQQQHGPAQQLFQQQSATRLRGHGYAASKPVGGLRFATLQFRSTPAMRRLPIQFRVAHAGSVTSSANLVRASSGKTMQPATVEAQVQGSGQTTQLSANPPHSVASDAWKGLIFSLMAAGRNADALQELARIPADVRRQLDLDVEFEQGLASLYFSAGDTTRANIYLNRVEEFYALRRATAPAGLELQHAWLLFNIGNDASLYPVLTRLDARSDLSAAQHDQLENLWANWAVRRAAAAMDAGNIARGVEILEAASEQYPNNLTVRRAVAGAYARVGRAAEAVAMFKTIPMENAVAGDYEGAVGAALAATDMVQAEAWLREALDKFPNDPGVLALAARFEQARGNVQRATDYWRAALAVLPPGASTQKLDAKILPQQDIPQPMPGDLKRMLDPHNDGAASTKIPPLPSYRASQPVAPFIPSARVSAPPVSTPQGKWLNTPSTNPLPPPRSSVRAPAGAPAKQTAPPIYTPQSVNQGQSVPAPANVEQATDHASAPHSIINIHQEAYPDQAGTKPNQPETKPKSQTKEPVTYQGKMNLPPAEQSITSTEADQAPAAVPASAPASAPNTAAAQVKLPPVPQRITSQPMGSMPAQVQALIADQTDSQLTQGSASAIHAIPNSSSNGLPGLNAGANNPASGHYDITQYTPSAQEAATGAYSAKQQGTQQTATPAAQQPAPPPVQSNTPPATTVPETTTTTPAPRKKRKASTSNSQTLGNAPVPQQQPQQTAPADTTQQPSEVPAPPPTPTTDTGLTDEELQQRNLPPLRGPWVRIQRQAQPVNPRDEAEMQLRSIEAGYSPWLGGTGLLNYRSGALGFDHLSALEAPFEVSMPLGYNARLTIVAKPVFLDSGQADGTSVITVQESTTAGSTLTTIPQPIGTLTTTDTNPPAQQNAVGIGGEAQLAFPHLAIAGGYTPAGFLVATFTARANWKPGNGPFTFSFSRDPVKDTQLSYSGLRDPSGNTLGTLGQIWGGVVANQGQVQYARGDAESGYYLGAGGQYLSGYTVESNTRVDGSGGAYWRLKTMPEYGNLSIGINFFGMHYAHNEDAFTHGMGGYFSPQAYFLANVPFTWVGHYKTRWHYDILGSLGVQAFQENLTPLWPLAVDKSLETSQSNAMLPAKTSVGPNYDLRTHMAYQISPHWFAGGFFGANNSRNYESVSAGFFVRYMFRAQPSTATTPTGIFPTDGLRPFTVP